MINIGIIRINVSFKNWIWVFLEVKDLLFMCFILVKKNYKKGKIKYMVMDGRIVMIFVI